ncbi:MAG: hypothetical protein ACE5Q3_15730 [Alphaproteobacteria bacterium]
MCAQRLKPRLTHDEIAAVVPDISDAQAAAIIATGATWRQLEEAVAWATGESDVMGELRHRLDATVASVYDILVAEEPEEED